MTINGYPVIREVEFSDPTLSLAASEMQSLCLKRFGGEDASWSVLFQLCETLPSFEVSFKENTLVIAGPTAVEILYGVYDFAEKFLGYFFFEPGRDILNGKGGGFL